MGGGIVGLAVARELLRRRPTGSLSLLERESELATHQSGHNSGVIHAGIYYAPGSLKARLSVEGARELYRFCELHDVPHERCGKLIVATGAGELGRLEELERRASANGVAGLRRLDGAALADVEPHARGVAALHSPDTGIVDFRKVALALARELLQGGASIHTGCEVQGSTNAAGGLRLRHTRGETLARHAVFCGGVWADALAGGADGAGAIRIVPFRGAYLRLPADRSELLRGLVYPVPDPSLPFLGVHLTKTIAGEVLLGPTALPALERQPSAPLPARLRELVRLLAWPGSRRLLARWWRTGVRELLHELAPSMLVNEAARYVPELRGAHVQRAFSGIRAQALARDGTLLDDFAFSYEERAVHVRSAPSPAATACLAIARHVADEVERRLGP